jgi:hypothetical protein
MQAADSIPTTPTLPSPRRADFTALWVGIAFSLLFTALIWWAGQYLDGVRATLLPDQGASWYYWKLPSPTIWTRLSAWGLYFAHQATVWGLIYYAQTRVKKYTTGLHRVNVIALAANAGFILLHFIQTHIWYDGLAQDVSIWSSQISVVILLIWVLLMENRRRGLAFGKKAPIARTVLDFARKYHGYYFAWAIIYTFWYHPLENTPGHLAGFVYMFLLLLQGSLFFTRAHTNKWWTLANEFGVLVHGTLVAVYQGNNMWPMFFFGFAGIFILTQMHGLALPRWSKVALFLAYAGGALAIYAGRGLAKTWELVAIPLIDYLGVFLLALIFWLILQALKALQRLRIPAS